MIWIILFPCESAALSMGGHIFDLGLVFYVHLSPVRSANKIDTFSLLRLWQTQAQ